MKNAGIKQTTEESSQNANLYLSVKSLKKLCHYGSKCGIQSPLQFISPVNSKGSVDCVAGLGKGAVRQSWQQTSFLCHVGEVLHSCKWQKRNVEMKIVAVSVM